MPKSEDVGRSGPKHTLRIETALRAPGARNRHRRTRCFATNLENLIGQRYELAHLAGPIDWSELDREWEPLFPEKKEAPAQSTRPIAGLYYLTRLYKLSDEEVVHGWVMNPHQQYFCGEEYFQHQLPSRPTSMSRWRSAAADRQHRGGAQVWSVEQQALPADACRHQDTGEGGGVSDRFGVTR